jgi:hypothetical protein
MYDQDTTNPFLTEEDAEAVQTLVNHLIYSCAYTAAVDPRLSGEFATVALASAASASDNGDIIQCLRGLLFELARYMHVNLPEGIHVHELNAPEQLDPTGADPRVLVMAAGMEWFKAVTARQQDTADNILKALHKEVDHDSLPSAYVNVAAGSVVSLGLSLQASARHHHGDDN